MTAVALCAICFLSFAVLSILSLPLFGLWGLVYSWLAANVVLMAFGGYLALQKEE
jgi:hypothetical protein